MPKQKVQTEKVCRICKRSNRNDFVLGPWVDATKSEISAHFNCILYNPVMPDALSIPSNPETDSIGGVSTRYARYEGDRADRLVGLNTGFL